MQKKTSKKLASMLLVGGFILGNSSIINANEVYSDWTNHWGKDYIKKGMEMGWVCTANIFRPDDQMTRAEAVKVLNRVYGYTTKGDIPFNDVHPEDWFYDEIRIALHNNLISSDTSFRPQDHVTRQEFATMVSNIETGKKGDPNHDKYMKYEDYYQSGEWARNNIEYVIEKGYMGKGGKVFNPTSDITRAEVVTTLGRAKGSENIKDGMKLPNLKIAPGGCYKMPFEFGGAWAEGSSARSGENIIEGDLYVKYGDMKCGLHSYGSKNQQQYDKVMQFIRNSIEDIDFRLYSDWVYLQKYFEGVQDDNYIDPILAKHGIEVDYGSWKMDNTYLIRGLKKGIITREDAEKLALYNSVLSHIWRKTGVTSSSYDGKPYSAYQHIFEHYSDCDASAQFKLAIADTIGMNGMVAGGFGHQDVQVQVGNYWWVNGREPQLRKTSNPFNELEAVFEAPTYNLEAYYNK